MIPLRDTIPSRTFPLVNWFLIGANVLVFLYEVSLGPGAEGLIQSLGLVPARVTAALSAGGGDLGGALLPFLSSQFLHGGWGHLLFNMLYLYIFGDNVEDTLGHPGYLAFYLGCGMAAGALHFVLHPSSVLPAVGASGAIAGVMGAYFLLFPRSRILTLIPIIFFIQVVEVPAFFFLGLWFLGQLLSGGVSLAASSGAAATGVAFWAHVGGFAAGAAFILLTRRRR